jgi:peptidoglycan hydrolase-like protein with peptidoglycan-binding domain
MQRRLQMKPQMIVLAAIIAGLPAAAIAQSADTPKEPEKAQPDTTVTMIAANPYEDLFKQVQEQLRANGFDPGPPDGTFNSKTQAALAQFQLSRAMPASGALDEPTLNELGVEPRTTTASTQAAPVAAARAEAPRKVAAEATPAEAAPAKVAAEDAKRPPQ